MRIVHRLLIASYR